MSIVDALLFPLAFATTLGCGLMAGLFFAFSVAVMKALANLPSAEGIAAMQSINVAIINPWFLSVFLGTAAGCAFVLIVALWRWDQPASVAFCLGSALYLVGNLLVTMLFNVPKNDALAAVAPNDPEGASLWSDYRVKWTAWNHVRTVTALGAAAVFTIGLCYGMM